MTDKKDGLFKVCKYLGNSKKIFISYITISITCTIFLLLPCYRQPKFNVTVFYQNNYVL